MKCHARWPASRYSLHAQRAAPRDDHEGQQLHGAKLLTQVGVVFLRRRHGAPGEADQPGHLQLGLNGFLLGEDIRSTNKHGGDRDPVRRKLEVSVARCNPARYLTLLWPHRLGHPSLARLHGMHSRLLVSGLPRSLPPLPPSPAPPCLPCVEGLQRAAPHSSSFPPTSAPLQDLSVLRLHSDRGGEFSSNLLWDFCRGEGILQSFTLPESTHQNGIAERRIGLVMEPRLSFPETSPTPHWTGKVGDASVFRVRGSWAFVRDTSAEKLSARTIPCVFLGFPPDMPGSQFYHPTLRPVFPSQDVTFDESVPFYRLFPYRSAPPPPPPLFLAPGPLPIDPLPPQGPAPTCVSQVDPLPVTVPFEVDGDSGAASGGAASGGVEPAGAEPGGAEPGGAESKGAESGGAEPEGAEPGGAKCWGDEPWVSKVTNENERTMKQLGTMVTTLV
ncbi:unnamed protein product [Closterium sp. NIES-53]